MTAQPLTHFQCDRCDNSADVAMSNTPTATRYGPPEGWLTLGIGVDPSTPPKHLCVACTGEFHKFMQEV